MPYLSDPLDSYLPRLAGILLVFLVLYLTNRFLEHRRRSATGLGFSKQLIMALLGFVGLLVVIILLPIDASLKNQLLALIGLVLSAAIALSSTTILGNALAGFMLRVVKGFRIGDFIDCEGQFGRVTEFGLFHTEIQNEYRELITLPNLYLVTHPVTTTRTSGTVIFTNVSLGYDVPRELVEDLLLQAAEEAGLVEPFVHVQNLGDFSVTYRVAGMLTEVKQILSSRSRLRTKVMDHLHRGGVEIVSPGFMNQRVLPEDREFIPVSTATPPAAASEVLAEEMVFDKAEEAESLESLRERHDRLLARIVELKNEMKKADSDTRTSLKERLEKYDAVLKRLSEVIKRREEESG